MTDFFITQFAHLFKMEYSGDMEKHYAQIYACIFCFMRELFWFLLSKNKKKHYELSP